MITIHSGPLQKKVRSCRSSFVPSVSNLVIIDTGPFGNHRKRAHISPVYLLFVDPSSYDRSRSRKGRWDVIADRYIDYTSNVQCKSSVAVARREGIATSEMHFFSIWGPVSMLINASNLANGRFVTYIYLQYLLA